MDVFAAMERIMGQDKWGQLLQQSQLENMFNYFENLNKSTAMAVAHWFVDVTPESSSHGAPRRTQFRLRVSSCS